MEETNVLVVGKTQELKVATTVKEANELLNEGWSLLDAKVESSTKFVLLLGWFGAPRQEIHRYFEKSTTFDVAQNLD